MASNLATARVLATMGINPVVTRVSGIFRLSTSFPCCDGFSATLGARKCLSPDSEQVIQLFALACENPAESGRPISHWTAGELASEMVKRGIVQSISYQIRVDYPLYEKG